MPDNTNRLVVAKSDAIPVSIDSTAGVRYD
jgi:hypothetical protein